MHTFQTDSGRQFWEPDTSLCAFTSIRENGEGVLGLGKKNGILYQLKPLAGLLMKDECLRRRSWVAQQPKERKCSPLACTWASLRGVMKVGK